MIESKIKNACFEITDKCPCKCLHCSSDYNQNTEIPYDNIVSCIDDFKTLGGVCLELSGGDPTEHNDFPDILKYASEKINNITVFSNNIRYDNAYFVNLLKKNKASLSFTILGNRNTHDKLMGIKSYDNIFELYTICKQNNVKVDGHFILMKQNIHEINEVFNIFPEIKVLRLMPQGKAYDNWDKIQVKNSEISEVLKSIKKTGSHISLPFCYEGKCMAGISQFLITALGTVVPCASFKRNGVKIGNIYNDRLIDILSINNERYIKWLKMKKMFIKNDEIGEQSLLTNESCWGNYLHDGMKHPLSYNNLIKEFSVFDSDYSKWVDYPENRIFIIGAHGVGKSTIIDEYSKEFGIKKYENNSDNPHKDNVYKRQLWRLYKYKFDDENTKNISDDTVIINRNPIDWIVYTNTFKKMNWLSEIEHNDLMNRYHQLFNGLTIPKNVYFVNPDIKWSKERIIDRWELNGEKWRESDMYYYEMVRKEYVDILNPIQKISNCIEISETDRDKRLKKIQNTLRIKN